MQYFPQTSVASSNILIYKWYGFCFCLTVAQFGLSLPASKSEYAQTCKLPLGVLSICYFLLKLSWCLTAAFNAYLTEQYRWFIPDCSVISIRYNTADIHVRGLQWVYLIPLRYIICLVTVWHVSIIPFLSFLFSFLFGSKCQGSTIVSVWLWQ